MLLSNRPKPVKELLKDAMGETVIRCVRSSKTVQPNGTITGIDGDFTLSGVSEGSILVISYVGYVTQEVKFNGQPLNVILKRGQSNIGRSCRSRLWCTKES